MAGDWIKVQVALPDKPEVWQIAGIIGVHADEVVGKLIRVWAWFDAHTQDGHASSVTYPLLDRVAGVTGFAEAMQMVGWLGDSGTDTFLPNFDRHNGKTAKNRALATDRKVTQRSRNERDKSVTREEKRREEKKEAKSSLAQQAARFDEFWSAYPVKKGKPEALKKWKARNLDAIADRIIADVKARRTGDRQWLDGYIPHGSTYVSGSKWEDAIEPPRQKIGNGSGAYVPLPGER